MKTTKSMSMNLDECDENSNNNSLSPQAFMIPITRHEHHYYLTGQIGEAEEYSRWIQMIRSASDEDEIYFHINSDGGDVFTALQLLRALGETQALKIISVEGLCMSAATFFLTIGDRWVISDHSTFMFHTYRGKIEGKGGEMWNEVDFQRKWAAELMRDVYDGLLDEQEIQTIIKGEDIWMDSKQINEKLNVFFQWRSSKRNELPEPLVDNTPYPEEKEKKPTASASTPKTTVEKISTKTSQATPTLANPPTKTPNARRPSARKTLRRDSNEMP